ncbi:MAG: hypothetical protein LBR60_08860 [Fibrobacter sp.]|jgi:hypothetical protein|nr:hypothetical protein [Fibrobacter sp.]
MVKSPLKNMIPLNSRDLESEFKDVCDFIFNATRCQALALNKDGCSYLKKGIQEVLRCFGLKFRPSRISEKAYNWNEENCRKVLSDDDTYKEWYPKRKQFRPLFLEHIIPLGSLIDQCVKCTTFEDVQQVLSELEFVIILKSEDDLLGEKYWSKGRETIENAEKAYQKCGIKLMNINV